MKVFITGGCGSCATALLDLPCDKVFFDRCECIDELTNRHFIQGDINDTHLLTEAMQGCDAVIHLAAWHEPPDDWVSIIANNIEGTLNVMNAACELNIERVIFASTNHVVGMYELDNTPQIYEQGHNIIIDRNTPVRPDTPYGISKVFGEQLGRYMAGKGGPRFYAIRIGSVLDRINDHPFAYAEAGVREGSCERNSEAYQRRVKRLKATWLSRRDFAQLIHLCLQYNGPVFDIFYGVSDNSTRWFDIEHAKDVLGYQPKDNAEYFRNPPIHQNLSKPTGLTLGAP